MRRAAVNGGELEYDVRGAGEPVLLIHGALVADAFLPMLDEPSLAAYRLIHYHRRGHAGSSAAEGPPETYIERAAADALALLRHLTIESAHVVGHSSGAVIALQLARDAPEAVRSLVLMEPPLLAAPSGAAHGQAIASVAGGYFAGDAAGAADGFMRLVGGPDWRTAAERRVPGCADQAERDARTFFELELPAAGGWPFDARKAKRITQSVLFLQGDETLPFHAEAKDIIHAWLPQTKDRLVHGVGHMLQLYDPPAAAGAIAEFLTRRRTAA